MFVDDVAISMDQRHLTQDKLDILATRLSTVYQWAGLELGHGKDKDGIMAPLNQIRAEISKPEE